MDEGLVDSITPLSPLKCTTFDSNADDRANPLTNASVILGSQKDGVQDSTRVVQGYAS